MKLLFVLLVFGLVFSSCSVGMTGSDGLEVSGDSDSVTIGLDGTVVRGVQTDSGNATGSGHWLKIEGAGNVSTSASGNVVTITFAGGSVTSDMSLAEGHIFVGNTSGLAEDMELSGDATLNGLGELDVTWADQSQSADTANSSTDSDKLDGLHGSSYLLGNATAVDSDKVDGSHASAFLVVAGTAADSDKLDGLHGSSYLLGNSTTIDADKVDGSHASAFLAVAGTAADSDKVDGSHASAFLAVAGTAADSDKLDGSHASAFLAVAGTAADSDKLDGVHGSGYVSSRLESKVKSFSLALNTASGDVSYTSIGFTPSSMSVVFGYAVGSTYFLGTGFADSGRNSSSVTYAGGQSSNFICMTPASAFGQAAVVKSYDADGFTLTWTRSGSISVYTLYCSVICYR